MNNIKKLIIILSILILVIICILIILQKTNKDSENYFYVQEFGLNDTLERVIARNDYVTVKSIVDNYYNSLCNLNSTIEDIPIYEQDESDEDIEKYLEEEKQLIKEKIYNFFDEEYIKETKLSPANIQEKLGNYNDLCVLIEDMYVRDITNSERMYFVKGTLTEKDTLKTEEFELMIAMCINNSTFNIYTSDYINKHNLYELMKNKDIDSKIFGISEIENRKYNKYEYQVITDEAYVKELLKNYTESIKYNINYSYNKLDEEYKKAKFGELSNYQKYFNQNKININTAFLKYYKVNIYEGYRQYIAIDQRGFYYIFNETSVMNYTLILDTYTIDLPEFIEKYEVATTEEKVALNIQKIVEALNAQDYKYVYNKLANEFKANHFKTYEDFEKYAQNTFDIRNEVTYNKYTETQDLSTYQITLKGKNKTITKTIVMKLEEGTDFVMSFNVE